MVFSAICGVYCLPVSGRDGIYVDIGSFALITLIRAALAVHIFGIIRIRILCF